MNIFIGSFFVILILGAICKKICNGKKMFCIGSGTIYFLVAALRSSYVGGDSFNYRRMFELLADKNIKFAFAYSEKDPIFNVLLSLLGKVTDNYSVLFAIVAVLFTITVWVYIYKYSDDPVLSVIVLLAFNLYQFSLTGMRQTIAISFVVLAIMAVHEEKKIQPYIWVLIASLFHSSALVCLSIPILSKIRISSFGDTYSLEEFYKQALTAEVEAELESQSYIQETIQLIDEAYDLGVNMYIISDFYLSKEELKTFLKRDRIDEKIDQIFVSSDYRNSKQQGGLYDCVCQTLGVNKDQCVMLGDNENSDVKNAEKSGIKGFLLNNSEGVYTKDNVKEKIKK